MTRAEWFAALRTAWDDCDAVARDTLRPPEERNLGPAKHRELYGPAADTIEHLLDHPPEGAPPEGAPWGPTRGSA